MIIKRVIHGPLNSADIGCIPLQLFEEFSTQAIAENDAYSRFQAYAAQGDPKQDLPTAAVIASSAFQPLKEKMLIDTRGMWD